MSRISWITTAVVIPPPPPRIHGVFLQKTQTRQEKNIKWFSRTILKSLRTVRPVGSWCVKWARYRIGLGRRISSRRLGGFCGAFFRLCQNAVRGDRQKKRGGEKNQLRRRHVKRQNQKFPKTRIINVRHAIDIFFPPFSLGLFWAGVTRRLLEFGMDFSRQRHAMCCAVELPRPVDQKAFLYEKKEHGIENVIRKTETANHQINQSIQLSI